jgi:hypothetical protein
MRPPSQSSQLGVAAPDEFSTSSSTWRHFGCKDLGEHMLADAFIAEGSRLLERCRPCGVFAAHAVQYAYNSTAPHAFSVGGGSVPDTV